MKIGTPTQVVNGPANFALVCDDFTRYFSRLFEYRRLDNTADLMFIDPPYNIGIDYGPECNDRRSNEEYRVFLTSICTAAHDLLRPGGHFFLLVGEKQSLETANSIVASWGREADDWIILHEAFAQYNPSALTREWRSLFHLVKLGATPTWNPDAIRVPSVRMKMGDKRASGPRVPGNVWEPDDHILKIRRLQGTSLDRVDWHPAQLAPELLTRLVRGWTNPGDLVVEGCCGSGSLARVALREGRRYIGVDTNPEYLSKIQQRLEQEFPNEESKQETVLVLPPQEKEGQESPPCQG